jgi:hypothetical protein
MILSDVNRGVREFPFLPSRIEKIISTGMVRYELPLTPLQDGETTKTNSPLHRCCEII